MDQKLVFVDLETAGTNPDRHPIIQIAAIAADASLAPIEAFEAKVRFSLRTARQTSLRKNHYHPGTWAQEAQAPAQVARAFADFLRRHATVERLSDDGATYHVAQLAAHQADFDATFLRHWYRRLGLYLPAAPISLCTVQRSLAYFAEHPELRRPNNLKLATLCDYFGIPLHAAAAHEALADVTATLALYHALVQNERRTRQPTTSAGANAA